MSGGEVSSGDGSGRRLRQELPAREEREERVEAGVPAIAELRVERGDPDPRPDGAHHLRLDGVEHLVDLLAGRHEEGVGGDAVRDPADVDSVGVGLGEGREEAPGVRRAAVVEADAEPVRGPTRRPGDPAGEPVGLGDPDPAKLHEDPLVAREGLGGDQLAALRAVVDPEIGMNVVELALIKQIILGPDSTEVKMILTTPFCPYAGSMIQQVKDQAESVVDHDVKVTLLAERWDPRDAGLMW